MALRKTSIGDAHATVAVVGLGPVGALLSGLLGRRGVHVIALERSVDVFPLPRAAHIDHTGLRAIQELGCVDQLLAEMIPNPGIDFSTAQLELLHRIPGDKGSASGLPASMYFHQPEFDRTLRQALGVLPSVDVRLGAEVTGVELSDDSVALRLADGGSVTADWAVACDGASSTLREARDIPLDDLGFHADWIVVDLVLSEPVPSLPDHAVTVCDPRRPLTAIPMPGPRYRFEFMTLPGEDPQLVQSAEVVERLLEPWVPAGVARIERAASYTFHGLVAERWREGRMLLAGDAAHQMPPFLGQGMCSGMRDATNLAWKLDMVARHDAPDSLLDSYETEREPHVRAIVEAAVELGRIACVLDPQAAAERDRAFLADSEAWGRNFDFRLPRLSPGPLVLPGGGNLFVQPQAHEGVARLDDLVGPRFLVLARANDALESSASFWSDQLGALVTTLDELPSHGEALRPWLDRRGLDVVVVRPDRYVLGGGEGLDAITDAVRPALSAKAGCAGGA